MSQKHKNSVEDLMNVGSLEGFDFLDKQAADLSKAINVWTKTLLWKLTEGHPVTPEEIEALNDMRAEAGMEPLNVPAEATSAAPAVKSKAPTKKAPSKYPEAIVRVPADAEMLPDNDMWQKRFKFQSDSGSEYLISQSKTKGYWGCTCWPWKKTHHCKHLEAFGIPGGDEVYQAQLKRGSKTAAELIHSDSELGQKMETVPQGAHIEGPEAGAANDELHENSHDENGLIVTDGDLKSPERQNVNAIREALETQVEMEVGKPIEQKQQEVAMQEKVQDAALAQGAGSLAGNGGTQEVSAKPGTQIIINVASKKKTAGEYEAESYEGDPNLWYVHRIDETGADQIVEENLTEEAAWDKAYELNGVCPECEHPLKQHDGKYGCEYERGDHPGGEGDHGPYGEYAMGPCGCMWKPGLKRSAEYPQWCDACIMNLHPEVMMSNAAGHGTVGKCEKCGNNSELRTVKVGSVKKTAYVKHCPGHKNSKGEKAEWCIYSHETGKIISSEKSQGAAKKQLQNMHAHSGSKAAAYVGYDELTSAGQAVLGRIQRTQPELVMQYGQDAVLEAVYEATSHLTDLEEIGSSDVSIWTKSVVENLAKYGKKAAEPIGGEPEQQSVVTSGHAGGMFGGTDLEGPQFHVGFTFRGKQRKAKFSSYTEAHTFIAQASVKFGKMAGDWTMKCPKCGAQASKDKPQDSYQCSCGWNSHTAAKTASSKRAEIDMGQVPSAQDIKDRHSKPDKTAVNYVSTMRPQASTPGIPKGELLYLGFHGPEGGHGRGELKYWGLLPEKLYNRIVRSLKTTYAGGSPEELRRASNELFATLEPRSEQVQPGTSSDDITARFKQASKKASIDPAQRGLVMELLKQGPKTTKEIEIALGGRQHTNIAYPIMQELAKDGVVAHKQMRWSLKSAGARMGSVNVRVKTAEMSVPEKHQLRIAIQTLKAPDAMVGVMGGMDKEQALQFLAAHGLRWDDADYMAGGKGVKKAGDGMAKTEEQLEKEAGFNLFFPGQVLQEFYPEIQHEIVDYPNASNSPMAQGNPAIPGSGNSEITGDGGHDLEGMLDSALDTSIVETIQLPADISQEPLSMAAADYSSTSPAGGMGIGRDGKPEVLEGVPLRKENDIRGAMFTDEFYGQYDGIPGAAFAVASVKTAAGDEKQQFNKFLKTVCGEIAATMVAAFKVTQRPLLDKVPGIGELQLDQIEQGSVTMPVGQTSQGGRVKYLMSKLNDGDIKAAINEAWAQAAVWNDSSEGGFIYEVFVRPETIDTDSMKMVYKFVAGTRG